MSELSYEASDEASENELLERSLSVWRGWSSLREDFTPIPLDIHTASSIGQYECVRTLIARGEVEIDRKNIGGWTPLMYACYIGHDHIVNLLIDAGCNVNLKNQRGQTPLMLAASCGNESVGRTLLRKGAELEAADRNGWTALFHATYSGHQNFVSFLLDQRANMDAVEPSTGMTPFMEAALEGHEIIVQLFLQHGVHVNAKAYNGDTARSLALMYGYMKIVSLIDNHVMPHSTLRSEPGLDDYLSSSDEVDKHQRPQHQRNSRAKSRGPSIRDGPEAIARMIDRTRAADHMRYPNLVVPRGYMTFPHGDEERADTLLSYRDVTSPINQDDYRLDSSGGKDSNDYNDDSNAFSKTGAITIKSSSSSSGGLIAALGLSRQNSADSDDFVLHDSGVHNSSQSEDNVGSVSPRNCQLENGAGVVAGSKKPQLKDKATERVQSSRNPQCVSASVCGAEGQQAGNVTSLQEQEGGGRREESDSSKSEDARDSVSPNAPCSNQSLSAAALSENSGEPESEVCALTATKQGRGGTEQGTQLKGTKKNLQGQDSKENTNDSVSHDMRGQLSGVRADTSTGQSVENYTVAFSPVSKSRHRDATSSGGAQVFDPSFPHSGTEILVAEEGVRCLPLTDKAPVKHLQRRSSCQARLSRLSAAERDSTSHTEHRHRRRSANSPPTFHREFDRRCPDPGHGTGRVSCLSDIPSNAGPQAGYPITTATPLSTQPSAADRGGDACDGSNPHLPTFHQHQIPVAAVAPTCIPPNYASTPHPVSTPLLPVSPHKEAPPSLEPGSNPTSVGAGLEPGSTDSNPASHETQPQAPATSLSALVQQLPGGGDGDVGGRGHCDLAALLEQLGLSKYTTVFVEQDVDLQVFLSLTDNDLKEIGIKLFGPRKKMTNAIARWHSQAPAARSSLEQAYADRLEGEMQEMAIQLNQVYDSVEKLRAQVLQERQLRSVTESCLMEERAAWQRTHHTLLEANQRLRDVMDKLSRLAACQTELKKRMGKPQNHTTPLTNTPLGNTPIDPHSLSSEQLSELCEQYTFDLRQMCATLTRHMDRLVSSPPATGGIHNTRGVEEDFP